MPSRRFVLAALFCLVLNFASYAQSLNSEQSLLSNTIVAFLKEQGFQPETGGSIIGFDYNECRMVIRIDPQEIDPMFVSLAAVFELPKDYSPQIVFSTANYLNRNNGVKILAFNESFSVQTEMFLTDAEDFTSVFKKMAEQILAVVSSFAETYSNAYSANGSIVDNRPKDEGVNSTTKSSNNSGTRNTRYAAEGVYNNPKVSGQLAAGARIKRVEITDDYTCVEISSNSTSSGVTAEWCNIDSNTYIVIEDKQFDKLKLIRASGIKVAPDKTYYGGPNRTISFKLYFPPVPKDTRSISLIEPDSSWCFYGITLHQ